MRGEVNVVLLVNQSSRSRAALLPDTIHALNEAPSLAKQLDLVVIQTSPMQLHG